MANMVVADGKFVLTKTISGSGTTTTTLQTQGMFVDKNIDIITSTAAGALSGGTTSLTASDTENILTEVSSEPASGEYITIVGQGSVSVGTAGWIAQGTSADSSPGTKYYTIQSATFTVDGASVKSVQKGYVGANQTLGTISNGVQSITGGTLSEGAKSSNITSNGYFDGSSYDGSDKVELEISESSGYYKITAGGSAVVNRAAVTKQVTTAGYFAADGTPQSAIAADSITVTNTAQPYFIKKSTLSADSATSSNVQQTITVYAGYYPSNRTITIAAIAEVTPTTSLSNTGMDTYFTAGTSGSHSVSVTPQYSNTAGYVAAHTNTNNGGIEYYTIITQDVTETSTTVSGTTATRGTRSESVGWKSSAETLDVAVFGSAVASGKQSTDYVDISGTTAAPILVAGDYLYINKGWTDDVKISLSKLVPDGSDVKGHSEYILSGHSAYDNDGILVSGSIATYTGAYTVA